MLKEFEIAPKEILNSPGSGVEYTDGIHRMVKNVGGETITFYAKDWNKMKDFYKTGN